MADLYRAMAKFSDQAGEYTVGVGGLRHEIKWAEEDIEATEGYVDAWIEEATWTRVAASTRNQGGPDA